MLNRFFRKDQPIVFLLLPLLLAVLWPGAGGKGLPGSAEAALAHMPPGMPLFAPVRWLLGVSPWAAMGLGFVLMGVLAQGMVRMANNAELFERRNHLPVLLLPLLFALFPFGLVPDPAFLGGWMVVLAMERTWTAVARKNILAPLFDAGLLLGLAGACYLPYTFLLVVIWATLAVTRPFQWREQVLPACGMAVMLLLCWGAVHFLAPGTWAPAASMRLAADAPPIAPAHWMYGVILWAVLAALAISAVMAFGTVYTRSVMREKNIRAAFLAFAFAMGLLALFAWLLNGRTPAALVAIPAAVLLSYPLLQGRGSAWSEAACWGLLLLALWARWAA